MANEKIRRSSMENLHLFDLDRWNCRDIPPPLPPPRQHQRSSIIEHSRTLYDMTRSQHDPIYAQTPMFTTIPRTQNDFHPRRIIGARIPPDIIQPISIPSNPSTPSTPQSADKSKDPKDDEHEENSSTDTEKNDDEHEEDDRQSDDDQSNGSSDSDEDHDDDDDDDDDDEILNVNDDQNEGIVEQIFNRDKPK